MTIWENIIQEKKILIAILVSSFGLFLNFIGICVGQGAIRVPEGATNPIGLYWYYLFFYILTLGSVIGAAATDSIRSYRIVLCTLMGITLSYIPENIAEFLNLSTVKQTGSGGGLAVAGLVFFILPLFPLLVWIGSEEDTPLNRGLSLEQFKIKGFKFGESTATLSGKQTV